MSYRVELSRQAKKAFLALPKRERRLAGRRLQALEETPHPPGTRALAQKLKGYYRLRVGGYRILYAVDEAAQLVRVMHIGPRHSVYDDFQRGL